MWVELFDTTLRDGTQSEGINLSINDKLHIARLLDEFGINTITLISTYLLDHHLFSRLCCNPSKVNKVYRGFYLAS